MLKKITTAVVLVTTCGLTGVAMAQSDGSSGVKSDGFYLEANLGWGKSDIDSLVHTHTGIKDSGFVWGGNLGYKFMPYLAAEVGFYGYPKIKVAADNMKVYEGVLAVKGILPLEDGFSLYAKTGPAWGYWNDDNNSTSGSKKSHLTWYFGLGANYNITENFYVGLGANYSLKRGSSTGTPASGTKSLPRLYSVTGNIGYIF